MTFTNPLILWPVLPFGGEEQNEGSVGNNDSGQGQSGQQSNGQQNQGNSQNQGGSSNSQGSQANSSNTDDDDPYAGLSAKELKRLLSDTEAKRISAESERDSVKGKLTEKERQEMDEIDRLKAEKEEHTTTIETLRATNAKLALLNAIGNDSRFTWHNTDLVADQLNREIVKVDDRGNVSGLQKELARVAKDHPYLLKTEEQQGNSQQQNNQQQQQNSLGVVTGFQPGQGGSNSGSLDQNAQELAKKYPALANRL
ncbi:scaffolding protein [Mycobacterium phage MrMiyagi]|uniref:Scaffolding protein n=1 Tax=Mycobacterium phage MrMiyagi TaxID=2762395 RepID=A0A7G8LPQ1_9CAUD|nr:scaffolding protein [Mycobacterium phage MrMiyagi]